MAAQIPFQTTTVGDGVQLAYIDSWHGRTDLPSSYTTVIGLHGVGFNSAIWTPLFAHLPADIRFVGYNQRSYAGSSPAVATRKEGGTDASGAYLQDLLGFFDFVVNELSVPAVGPDGKGGIALLGWSKGTLLLLSLLIASSDATPTSTSFLSSIPPSLSASHPSLLTHLHSLLLFEPPGSALGRQPTSDYTAAMSAVSPPNPSTPDEFADAFAGWIGGYSEPTGENAGVDDAPLAPSGLSDVQAAVGASAWQAGCVATGFGWRLAAGAAEVAALAEEAFKRPTYPFVRAP